MKMIKETLMKINLARRSQKMTQMMMKINLLREERKKEARKVGNPEEVVKKANRSKNASSNDCCNN